jgi:Icc-related predicted phosphoesterase
LATRAEYPIMLIDCISDLHGSYPTLPGGDLLIIAGDLTAHDMPAEYRIFSDWANDQDYEKIIVIGGNHDGWLQRHYTPRSREWCPFIDYLCDSGETFQGIHIWGSPWTPTFGKWHFMKDRGPDIKAQWDLIPANTDILITHGPPMGILDLVCRGEEVGCADLWQAVNRINPKAHIFGHVHEGYGHSAGHATQFVNCSHMNERYQPVNPHIRIEL